MKINKKYKILTPSGYESFFGIEELCKDEYYIIKFENDIELKCSIEHPFIYQNKKILASDLKVGSLVDGIKNKYHKIISIDLIKESIKLYDIINVDNGHIFLTSDIISSNCDASFETSGNTLIDHSVLEYYEQTFVKEPIEKRGFDQGLWIWDYVDYNKQYLVSADVSRGDSSDYSAFHVIEIEKLVQVAEYKGQLPTADFGHLLVNIATEYNNALLIIENANVGWAAIQPAIDRDYNNLFYSYKNAQLMDVQSYLNKGYDLKNKEDMTAGFTTSSKTRPLLVSKIELLIRERLVVIQSKRTIEELKVFIWLNNKAQAASGYNDDLVLALGIGLWIRDTAIKLMKQGTELNRKALELFNTSTNMYGNIMSSNNSKVGHYLPPNMKNWSTNSKGFGGKSNNGVDEDLSWLL